ncbi:MAG: hypothetical protein IPH84_18310 [Bacteroidales bacterium]|nr:hypothetical protein [Bacteroidales bacterium]
MRHLLSNSLGGNTPVVGTGAWSIVSGGTGTFTAPTSGNSNFVANGYATYVLRWTISNGTCAASTDDITVTFLQAPTTAMQSVLTRASAVPSYLQVLAAIPQPWVQVHGLSYQVVQVLLMIILIQMQPSLLMHTVLMY